MKIRNFGMFALLFLTGLVAESKTQLNFKSKDGTRLYGEYYQAREPKAFMLVVHGLQSHSGWYVNGQKNAQAGITSFAYDRRGSGMSDGMHGHAESVSDFMDDFEAALKFVRRKNRSGLPIHIMANSLGAVVTLHYFAMNKDKKVDSIILTTPGTHSTDEGDYPLLTKLAILTASSKTYFRSPIVDEHFVDEGNFLDWIKGDPLARRKFTAGFLRSVNLMKMVLDNDTDTIEIPMFALMAKGDEIIDNQGFVDDVFSPYRAEKKIRYYDSKHYLFFGNDRERVAEDIREWILNRK